MIELHGCGSPNVLKVLLMLEEVGEPYRFTKVDVYNGGQFAPGFTALNPNAKVPVIVDDEGPAARAQGRPLVLAESNAILFYLAEKHGQRLPDLLPAAPAERAALMQWLMFQTASVGPMFGQALHFQYIAPKAAQADSEAGDYARRRYLTEVKRLYEVIEARLATSPWLAGDTYSIADIATYPWAGKYRGYPGFDARTSSFPHLARWAAAIEARPAYQRIDGFFAQLFKDGLRDQQSADPDQVDRFFGRGRWFRA